MANQISSIIHELMPTWIENIIYMINGWLLAVVPAQNAAFALYLSLAAVALIAVVCVQFGIWLIRCGTYKAICLMCSIL